MYICAYIHMRTCAYMIKAIFDNPLSCNVPSIRLLLNLKNAYQL